MLNFVVLDCETRGSSALMELYLENIQAPKTYKDPEKIAEYIRNKQDEAFKGMAVDPDFNEIICIGIKEEGKEGVLLDLQGYADWLKGTTEMEYGAKVQNLYRKCVTFNGKSFDFPTIIRAGIKQGIDLPYVELMGMCEKFKSKNHIDLMQDLAVGYNNYKSLDKYLQIYLGIAKTPIDFDEADDDEIKRHCLEDLANTEKLFLKFKPLYTWSHAKDKTGTETYAQS